LTDHKPLSISILQFVILFRRRCAKCNTETNQHIITEALH